MDICVVCVREVGINAIGFKDSKRLLGGSMRSIKFRAWLPVGEWSEDGESQKYEMVGADALAFEEYEPLCDLLAGCENLMQFTGLKDKNGNEIYEGDIIKVKGDGYYSNNSMSLDDDWEFIGKVCFNSFMWSIDDVHSWMPLLDASDDDSIIDIEIIGNIHENPELLGARK